MVIMRGTPVGWGNDSEPNLDAFSSKEEETQLRISRWIIEDPSPFLGLLCA